MQIIFTCRSCEMDAESREALQLKFDHLERYEPRASRAEVTITAGKKEFEVEALISIDRADRVHAHANASEMRDAVDRVVEKLKVQLRRLHSRHHEHRAPPMDEIFTSPNDDPERLTPEADEVL